ERGRPVARVHVADRDQIAGPEKGQELLEERPLRAGLDGAKNFRERRRCAWPAPARFRDDFMFPRFGQHGVAATLWPFRYKLERISITLNPPFHVMAGLGPAIH